MSLCIKESRPEINALNVPFQGLWIWSVMIWVVKTATFETFFQLIILEKKSLLELLGFHA